jgi:hypothetical protein
MGKAWVRSRDDWAIVFKDRELLAHCLLVFLTEAFRTSESIWLSRVDWINVIKLMCMWMWLSCLIMLLMIMITCISACVYVWTQRLQAKHPNLGQPSQTVIMGRMWRRLYTVPSTEGSDVVSLLRTWGPNMGMRWTNLHQHQQHPSSSSMFMFSDANAKRWSHKCIIMYICQPFFILLQVKNKPYQLGEQYVIVLENGAVATNQVSSRLSLQYSKSG